MISNWNHRIFPKNIFFLYSDKASIEDKEAFLREISLMKSVQQHENIVGIVGHSTIDLDRMMLLTEFCSEGNLLDYLR